MNTKIFVTCGRGLSTFAVQEIGEKIPEAYDIQSLGEGKLSFTINHPSNLLKSEYFGINANEGPQSTQKEFLSPECHNKAEEVDDADACAKKQQEAEYIYAIAPVYKLKLVERIFMLLHCEQIGKEDGCSEETPVSSILNGKGVYNLDTATLKKKVPYCEILQSTEEMSSCKVHSRKSSAPADKNILNEYEKKLTDVMKNNDWTKVAGRVQVLRDYHDHSAGNRVLCHNPDICPGSVNRKTDKKQLQQKREATLLSSGLTKKCQQRNKQKRSLSFSVKEKYLCGKNCKRRKLIPIKGLELHGIIKEKGKVSNISNQCYPKILPNTDISMQDGSMFHSSEVDDEQLDCNMVLRQDVSSECNTVLRQDVSPELIATVRNDTFQVTDNIFRNVVPHNSENSPNETTQASAVIVPIEKTEICPGNETVSAKTKTFGKREQLLGINAQGISDAESTNEPGARPKEHITVNQYKDTSTNGQSVSFRVSCRISGPHKNVLTTGWLTHKFVQKLCQVMDRWITNWQKPVMDFYINITESHFVVGVALAQKPLSLRRYIPHLTLRSTVCYLMAKLSHLPPDCILLDPMCGGGTILLEAVSNFKVSHVIASDMNLDQLKVAKCNLNNLHIPVSLLQAPATALPLLGACVNVVVCDFPFGQKYKMTEDSMQLLKRVLLECQRVLVCGGRAVFLLSRQQQQLLFRLVSHTDSCNHPQGILLKVESVHFVSLGETSAVVAVLVKDEELHL